VVTVAKADGPCCQIGDAIAPTETGDGLAIRAGLSSTPTSPSQPTETPTATEVSGLSIGYAIHNSTKTTASHDLTDLELIEVPIDPSPHLARAGVQHTFARAGCYCAVRMTKASVFPS
jgi:hypothetical protein